MHRNYFNVTQPLPAFDLIYLGWIKSSWIKEIDPRQSGNQSQTVTIKNTRLAPSSGNYNVARIRIPGGTADEHFLVESRQGTGSDTYLSSGGKGLIIWHLNKSYGTYNTYGTMDVEIATTIGSHGQDWLDNDVGSGEARGFITDFFKAGDKGNFAPSTNPSTETGYKYSGSHTFTDLGFLNISAPSSSMTFSFAENSPPAVPKNLVLTNPGADGSHPILQWSPNTEPDLANYRVWRGYSPNWKTTPPTWEPNPAATVTGTTWTDNSVRIDLDVLTSTYYRITAVDAASNQSGYSGQVSTTSGPQAKEVAEDDKPAGSLPREFSLHQNYPNPFNPATEIRYELPHAGHVSLVIFNIAGQTIRTLVDEPQLAGYHSILWDGRDATGNEVASGIYIYRFLARSNEAAFATVKKMTLLR
jgi:hypothetical protein